MSDIKTLIVACSHEAEIGFSYEVIKKYLENHGIKKDVSLILIDSNKGSNPQNTRLENFAYSEILLEIEREKPDLILDLHHGWNAKKESHSIHLGHDFLNYTKSSYSDFEEFLRNYDINEHWVQRPEILRGNNSFKWFTIETQLYSKYSRRKARRLDGQKRYNFMTAGIIKDLTYHKAILHTAEMIYILHTEFCEKFSSLIK